MVKKEQIKEQKPAVTIVIPTHSAPLVPVIAALKRQNYTGNVTIIALDNGERDRSKEMPKGILYIKNETNLGLAGSLNKGILLSKTSFVITLHQDCVPAGNEWLSLLMKPFLDNSVVLSASQQVLPKEVWNQFSFWHKVFAVPELKKQKTIHERATAYRRDIILSCGLFDNKMFRTAGEDTDLFMKMKKWGRFVVSDALVSHVHAPHNDSLWKVIKTFLRCHEAMGVLHRRYLFAMGTQFWYDFFRTILFLFLFIFLFYNLWISLFLFGLIVVFANITHFSVVRHIFDFRLFFLPFIYTLIWIATLFVMWEGFLTKKQTRY